MKVETRGYPDDNIACGGDTDVEGDVVNLCGSSN